MEVMVNGIWASQPPQIQRQGGMFYGQPLYQASTTASFNLWEGIKSVANGIANAAKDVVNWVTQALGDILSSPLGQLGAAVGCQAFGIPGAACSAAAGQLGQMLVGMRQEAPAPDAAYSAGGWDLGAYGGTWVAGPEGQNPAEALRQGQGFAWQQGWPEWLSADRIAKGTQQLFAGEAQAAGMGSQLQEFANVLAQAAG